tara:strand:+ start:30 stop:515 length:486 start_codon:yes stop_codon:yes gene_type:complete
MSYKKTLLVLAVIVCWISPIISETLPDQERSSNKTAAKKVIKPIRFEQEEMVRINIALLEADLSLKKRQIKKISAKYNKYLKKQLKIREKIVGKKVKLSRLMMNGFYEDHDFDSSINAIFSMKKKMFRNSVLFVKDVEDTLKKEQKLRYRERLASFYNPKL